MVTVGNTPSEVLIAELGPNPLYSSESISVDYINVRDQDNDDVSLIYEWFVDGVSVQTGSSAELSEFFFASNNQDETVSFIQCYMLAVTTPIEVNIKRKGKLYSGQYGGKWNIVSHYVGNHSHC